MTTYMAYLTVEDAERLTSRVDLQANVTHEGCGIVTLSDDAMHALAKLGTDDDGRIEREDAIMRMLIGGATFPVVGANDDVARLAATTAALPDMPLVARVVTARRLVDEAKRVYSMVADAAVVSLIDLHRGRGGCAAVAKLLGVSKPAIYKAAIRYGRIRDSL